MLIAAGQDSASRLRELNVSTLEWIQGRLTLSTACQPLHEILLRMYDTLTIGKFNRHLHASRELRADTSDYTTQIGHAIIGRMRLRCNYI
jgi:hypothetical protein